MSTATETFINLIRKHLEELSQTDRLIYLLKLLWQSDYGWGREHIGSVDCSGALSFALYLMGFNIRTTANGFENDFTKDIGMGQLPLPGDLLFFRPRTDRTGGSNWNHVAIFSDRSLNLLSTTSSTFQIVPISTMLSAYSNMEHRVARLDWLEIDRKARTGRYVWGVDPELRPMFGLFNIEELDYESPTEIY